MAAPAGNRRMGSGLIQGSRNGKADGNPELGRNQPECRDFTPAA